LLLFFIRFEANIRRIWPYSLNIRFFRRIIKKIFGSFRLFSLPFIRLYSLHFIFASYSLHIRFIFACKFLIRKIANICNFLKQIVEPNICFKRHIFGSFPPQVNIAGHPIASRGEEGYRKLVLNFVFALFFRICYYMFHFISYLHHICFIFASYSLHVCLKMPYS